MGYKDREENKIKTFLYCTVQGTVFINKQAENGLQSRSSENGKTAVHYGKVLGVTQLFTLKHSKTL